MSTATSETAPSELDAVELFHELIETCRESERGFTIASESVGRPELRRLFDAYAKQRRRFATELQVEVVRRGGVLWSPNEASRANGRAWPRMNGARIDDSTVLATLARAEDETARSYQEAETIELRSPLRTIIDRQAAAVLAVRNRIDELQRPCRKSA